VAKSRILATQDLTPKNGRKGGLKLSEKRADALIGEKKLGKKKCPGFERKPMVFENFERRELRKGRMRSGKRKGSVFFYACPKGAWLRKFWAGGPLGGQEGFKRPGNDHKRF